MLLRLNKPKLAASSLSALVDILKHTISRSDETISLEEEIHILKKATFIFSSAGTPTFNLRLPFRMS